MVTLITAPRAHFPADPLSALESILIDFDEDRHMESYNLIHKDRPSAHLH